MRFEHTKVMNFENAFIGMRNRTASWDESDSECLFHAMPNFSPDDKNAEKYDEWNRKFDFNFKMGKKDLALAQKLICKGKLHRTFLDQILVCVDITAPLYWWKEFDASCPGATESCIDAMHTITADPIRLGCFEIDDYNPDVEYYVDDGGDTEVPYYFRDIAEDIIEILELLRKKYIETNDKRYWKEFIRWLPESWWQTRTVTLSYENLLCMCSKDQYRFHELNEWSGIDNPYVSNFISWARTLPYAQELIFIDEIDDKTD